VEQKRGTLARIGITLLNLLAPGLGLLRLSRWRLAAAFYAVGLLLLLVLFFGPPLGFGLFALAVLFGLSAYPISMVVTWLHGRTIQLPRPWYGQWYSIVGAAIFSFAANFLITDESRARYRSFYVPSESMMPTLPTNDRFFAYMKAPKHLQRGDILLVRSPSGPTYVTRVAGLPGDEIAVTDGIVVLNGKPVAQRYIGTSKIVGYAGTRTARRLKEQFPGEASSHEIYDDGESFGDDFSAQRVRAGHVFLLGDNRDHAADSRFSEQEMGLEQLPITDILGWPMFHSFGSHRPIGEAINRRNM
jgi:signal peptidase I